MKQLKALASDWNSFPEFAVFQEEVGKLPDKLKHIFQVTIPTKFFATALEQVHKHNRRYLETVRLVRAAFGEPELGKYVARLILDKTLLQENEAPTFDSPMQEATIATAEWASFLFHGTVSCIAAIRLSTTAAELMPYLKKVANGFNIWVQDDPEALKISTAILIRYAANNQVRLGNIYSHCGMLYANVLASWTLQSQQNNERAVLKATRMRASGKSELQATNYMLAGNGFQTTFISWEEFHRLIELGVFQPRDDTYGKEENESDDEDEEDDDNADRRKRPKRKRLRGKLRGLVRPGNVCFQSEMLYANIIASRSL